MNILKESVQKLEVWHEYPMTTRTHALTTIFQSPTSIEYRLKILYLALLSITAVGHLLWDYADYDLRREQYFVIYTVDNVFKLTTRALFIYKITRRYLRFITWGFIRDIKLFKSLRLL